MTPAPTLGERQLQGLLTGLGVALIALYVATFGVRNTALQWDFRSCLAAAHAARAGLDPYVLENLTRAGHRAVTLPFLYPPVALVPFLGISLLPPAAALAGWMGIKALLLAGLIAGWHRGFALRGALLPLALIAVFGWNGAALWDLRAGNVALIECALLWAGFACFVRGRRSWFAVLVVIAACFKLMPAVFLALLLVPAGGRAPQPGLLRTALAALALLVGGPFCFDPISKWQGFLRHIPSALTAGDANPSGIGLAMDLASASGLPVTQANGIAIAVWVAFAIGLLVLSRRWIAASWRARDPQRWVLGAAMLFVLLSPRPMAYGYALLAPVPLACAPRPFDKAWGRLALALLLSVQGLARAAHQQPGGVLYMYAPFLLTLGLWALIVRADATGATSPPLAGVAAT